MYDFVFLESSFSASKWERKALERDYAYRLQYRSLHNPSTSLFVSAYIHTVLKSTSIYGKPLLTKKNIVYPSRHIHTDDISVGGGQGHHCTKINFHIWKVITEFDARNM